jgi:WD40 repeat protein
VQAEQKQGQLRGEADAARELVQVQAEKSRRQLIQLNVSSGNRLAEAGGYHPALLWFVEAMRLEQGDAAAEDVHRRRYAALRRFAPRLDAVWPLSGAFDVVFTADGKRVIGKFGGDEGRAWDIATGEPLGVPGVLRKEWFRGGLHNGVGIIAPDAAGLALSVSPVPGGLNVMDQYADREIRIFLAAPESMRAVSFSRDGKRAASLDSARNLYRWQLPESPPRVTAVASPDAVDHLTISADGGRIAVATVPPSSDVLVWDFASPDPVLHLQRPAGDVMTCRISPDGRLVAVGSWDRYARLYNASTGFAVGDFMRHARGVGTLDFSPDSKLLATAGWDGTARLWATTTGRAVSPSLYHGGYVPLVRFSPDGTRLATYSQDEIIRLWNVQASTAPARVGVQHGIGLYATALRPDGQIIVTAATDRGLKLWKSSDGSLAADSPQTACITGVAFTGDNRLLAAGFEDGQVELLDASTGKLVRKTTGHPEIVKVLQFSQDGSLLVSGSADGTVHVWHTATGGAAFPALRHADTIRAAAFSPDGLLLATASRDKSLRIWNALTGALVGKPLLHPAEVRSVSFSPDGTRLITAAVDATSAPCAGQIWNVATGEPAGPPLPHRDGVLHAGFSPDGKYTFTCGEDAVAMVWDAATGAALTPPLRHQSYVWRAAFSPDSRLLLTASGDNTARVWDARTGEPVTPPLHHDDSVEHCQWTPDGREVFTGAINGTVRLWDISPVTAPLDELQREAEVLSSHRLQPGLGITPLSTAEIRERWEAIRARK